MSIPKKAAIIDYGSGNLHSVHKACKLAASRLPFPTEAEVTSDASRLDSATHVILPGVGAYRDCITALNALPGMRDALDRFVHTRRLPFLGVCVGMQLLTSKGYEHGETEGLGWIEGETTSVAPGQGLPVPHMGWNDVLPRAGARLLPEAGDAYFVHSYAVRPRDGAVTAAVCEYGEERFACALEQGNIFASQFHPEKSRDYGLAMLERFLAL